MDKLIMTDEMIRLCSLCEIYQVQTEWPVDIKIANHMLNNDSDPVLIKPLELVPFGKGCFPELLFVPYSQQGFEEIKPLLKSMDVRSAWPIDAILKADNDKEYRLELGWHKRWTAYYHHNDKQKPLLDTILTAKCRYNAVRTMMETGGMELNAAEQKFFSNPHNKSFIAKAMQHTK